MNKTASKLFKIFFGIFVILIPWQTRWIFYDWSIGRQVWEYGRLGLYASMLVLLLASFFFIVNHKKELHFSRHNFLYFTFGFSVLIGFLSPIPLVSFYYLTLIYMAVLFAYLFRFVDKFFTMRLFLFSGLIQALLAIWQSLSQQVFANKWFGIAEHLPITLGTAVVEFGDQRVLRAYGSLPHPNILGGFLFVAIFVGLYLWVNFYRESAKHKWSPKFIKRHFWEALFIIISLVVTTFGILTTFSRTAILALMASVFSVLLINIFKRDWLILNIAIKYTLIFITIVIAFNWWFPGAWTARLQVDGRLEQQSVEERISTFDQVYTGRYKDLFFGQGLGMNTFVTYEQNNLEMPYEAQPVHDIFFLAFAEVGIIGILLLVNVVRLIIKEADHVELLSTSLLLGLIIIGLFDHYLWTTWTGWILVSFGLVNLYKKRK